MHKAPKAEDGKKDDLAVTGPGGFRGFCWRRLFKLSIAYIPHILQGEKWQGEQAAMQEWPTDVFLLEVHDRITWRRPRFEIERIL